MTSYYCNPLYHKIYIPYKGENKLKTLNTQQTTTRNKTSWILNNRVKAQIQKPKVYTLKL